MPSAQMLEHDRLVGELPLALDEVVKAEMAVPLGSLTISGRRKCALDHENRGGEQGRNPVEDLRPGVTAVSEPDLVRRLLDHLTGSAAPRDLLAGERPQLGSQMTTRSSKVVAETRHHVRHLERLHREIAADLDPVTRTESMELPVVGGVFEPLGGAHQITE